jgi:hypothetical protein
MSKNYIHHTIKTAILSAFTIAAALIWKDVIEEAIRFFMPDNQFITRLGVAVFATIIVIIIIYIILKTDSEAKALIRNLNKEKMKKK